MEKQIGQAINDLVKSKLDFIAARRESLVESFVAQHGFNPDEAMLIIRERNDGTTETWIEKRPTQLETLEAVIEALSYPGACSERGSAWMIDLAKQRMREVEDGLRIRSALADLLDT